MERWTSYLKREKVDDCDIHFVTVEAVADFARKRLKIANLAHEELWAIYVGPKLDPIGYSQIGMGALVDCRVPVQTVFRNGLLGDALGVFLVHNHPSGDHIPSKVDKDALEELQKFGAMIGFRVFDNIVVTANKEGSTQLELNNEEKEKND